MRFYLKKARWKCRHCGNTFDTENEPGKPMKQPGFCECKHRDFELDLNTSEMAEEEKIESPLFQQGKLNIFVDYVKLSEMFQEKQPYFYDKQKIWWLWNKEQYYWERIDETDIINAMDATVNGLFLFKSQTKSEIMNALKMQGRKKMPLPMEKTWIQIGKTIYDLKGNFFEASPKWFTTNPIPWDLTKSQKTETPNIDKLFNDWVNTEYVPLLYEICAYCMLSDYPIRRVFCLDGEGANGKSTYMKIIERLVGQKNVCTADFAILSTRFETAKLYKKLVCEMHEISHKQLKDTSTFKKLTGGDMMRFEFKGKDGFDDYSFAKLLIATNKLPESPDKSKGYFDRWCIIDFPNTFEEKPGLLDCIPLEEYENLARKGLKLLMQLLRTGKFTKEGKPEERRKRYEERSSPFNDFLKGFVETKEDGVEMPLWVIHEEYKAFLAERNYRIASRQEVAMLLRSRSYLIDRKHVTKEDGTETTMRYVYGLQRR